MRWHARRLADRTRGFSRFFSRRSCLRAEPPTLALLPHPFRCAGNEPSITRLGPAASSNLPVVRAELKSLFSADCPEGLEHYTPDDPADFAISLQAFIGSTDDDRVDSFDVLVCTPAWLAQHMSDPRLRASQPRAWTWLQPGITFGRNLLVVERWDYELLRDTLSRLCASFQGPDWGSLASRIDKYLPWEYDYRYERHQDEIAATNPFPPPE